MLLAFPCIVDLDAVTEFDAIDDLGQLNFAVQPLPGLCSRLDQDDGQ